MRPIIFSNSCCHGEQLAYSVSASVSVFIHDACMHIAMSSFFMFLSVELLLISLLVSYTYLSATFNMGHGNHDTSNKYIHHPVGFIDYRNKVYKETY